MTVADKVEPISEDGLAVGVTGACVAGAPAIAVETTGAVGGATGITVVVFTVWAAGTVTVFTTGILVAVSRAAGACADAGAAACGVVDGKACATVTAGVCVGITGAAVAVGAGIVKVCEVVTVVVTVAGCAGGAAASVVMVVVGAGNAVVTGVGVSVAGVLATVGGAREPAARA